MVKSVLCIGATLIDELYFCETTIVSHSSNPAKKLSSIGGVVSNIVQHLALLGFQPSLITALGNDSDANQIKKHFDTIGVSTIESLTVEGSSGKYVSVLTPQGDLYVAVCQDICSEVLSVSFLESKSDFINEFDCIIIDTNLDAKAIQWIIDFSKLHQKKLIIEPVSVTKGSKLAQLDLKGVFMITPNEEELKAIATIVSTEEIAMVTHLQKRGVENVWVRKGDQGSVMYDNDQIISLKVPSITVQDSTGAGDAALAAWVFGHLQKESALTSLQLGHSLALEVLQIKGAVLSTLNVASLYQLKNTYYNV